MTYINALFATAIGSAGGTIGHGALQMPSNTQARVAITHRTSGTTLMLLRSEFPMAYVSESWCNGMAECLACGYRWVAVWVLGAPNLECLKCGSIDTIREREDG